MRIKKIDYKQFELYDKTDKKLTLNEEIKKICSEIKNRENLLIKRNLAYIFSYEPTALVNKLLGQNT